MGLKSILNREVLNRFVCVDASSSRLECCRSLKTFCIRWIDLPENDWVLDVLDSPHPFTIHDTRQIEPATNLHVSARVEIDTELPQSLSVRN